MGIEKLTSDEIADSWQGQFLFKKETCSSKGLRSPQIGALHALLAHVEDGNESAIIVMPTGTGKTETMLAFLVANVCKKVFVIVPSDALRSQTCRKFKKLGLLKDLGVVPYDIKMPIVSMIKNALDDLEWKKIIDESNVIITSLQKKYLLKSDLILEKKYHFYLWMKHIIQKRRHGMPLLRSFHQRML